MWCLHQRLLDKQRCLYANSKLFELWRTCQRLHQCEPKYFINDNQLCEPIVDYQDFIEAGNECSLYFKGHSLNAGNCNEIEHCRISNGLSVDCTKCIYEYWLNGNACERIFYFDVSDGITQVCTRCSLSDFYVDGTGCSKMIYCVQKNGIAASFTFCQASYVQKT